MIHDAHDCVNKAVQHLRASQQDCGTAEHRKLDSREPEFFLGKCVDQQTEDIKKALERNKIAYSNTLEALVYALNEKEHQTAPPLQARERVQVAVADPV